MKARRPVLRSQGEEPTASTGNLVDKEWAFCQTPLGSLHYIK